MTFGDNPESYEPKVVESAPAADMKAHEILAQVNVTTTNPPSPEEIRMMNMPELRLSKPLVQPEGKEGKVFFGHGYEPLVSMDLPGWVHQPRDPSLPPNAFREDYTPTQDGTLPVTITVRGMPPITDSETASGLRQLLTDQKIDDTKASCPIKNIESIRGALNEGQNIPKDFVIESAWTRTMQPGTRVLFVMGSYTHEDTKALTAYIDRDSRHPGQSLVAVNYFASKALFDKYLPSAEQAMMTMKLSRQSPEQTGSSSR